MGVKPVGDVRVAYVQARKIVEKNLVREFIDKAVGGSTLAVRWQDHRCDVAAQHQVPTFKLCRKRWKCHKFDFVIEWLTSLSCC